jgi:1,4-alpha-glucan branching enzyme
LYAAEKALWQDDHSWDGFQWIEPNNAKQSVIIFRRMGDDPKDDLVIIINFCPQTYPIYEIGVPQEGKWQLIFNSNSLKYGGSGETIVPSAKAEPLPFHNQPYNITIALPGLTALIYKKETKTKLPAKSSIHKPQKIDRDKKALMKTSHKSKQH